MCFSFEVSLGTGLFCWAVGIYLLNKKLNKNERQNIIFLLIFSSIQFADAILWAIKMKKNKINYIVTSFIIPFILSLQIIYNLYFRNNIQGVLLNIFAIFIVAYIFIKFKGYSISSCSKSLASPSWGSTKITLLEFIIFYFLITYPRGENLICLALIFGIMIINSSAFGSLWCAIACLLSFKYLYLYN